MKIGKKVFRMIVSWILLFLAITIILSTLFYGLSKINDKFLKQNVNKKLELIHVIDTLGNKVNLKFENKITIIDFWFQGCAFCVYEMNQFNSLLKGRENQISVYSISIDDSKYWQNPNSPYAKRTVNNWNFYALDSKSIPDKNKYLLEMFNINRFPSYLVVDNLGNIIEMPLSATAYIKENYFYKNWIFYFWYEILFNNDYILFKMMCIPYTILFWLTIFITTKIKRKSRIQTSST